LVEEKIFKKFVRKVGEDEKIREGGYIEKGQWRLYEEWQSVSGVGGWKTRVAGALCPVIVGIDGATGVSVPGPGRVFPLASAGCPLPDILSPPPAS
jgi:hypothetical protein